MIGPDTLDIVYVAPANPMPSHTASMQGSVRSNVAIEEAELIFMGKSPTSAKQTIVVSVIGEITSGSTPLGGVDIEIIPAAVGSSASSIQIISGPLTGKCDENGREAACSKWYRVTEKIQGQVKTFVAATLGFTYTGPPVGLDENGVNLLAVIPRITVGFNNKKDAQQFSRNTTPPAGIQVTYGLPGAGGYDWNQTSRRPTVIGNTVTWNQKPEGIVDLSSSYKFPDSTITVSAADSGTISVTNPEAIRQDNINSFIAGGLIGIGGGAVVSLFDIVGRKIDREE